MEVCPCLLPGLARGIQDSPSRVVSRASDHRGHTHFVYTIECAHDIQGFIHFIVRGGRASTVSRHFHVFFTTVCFDRGLFDPFCADFLIYHPGTYQYGIYRYSLRVSSINVLSSGSQFNVRGQRTIMSRRTSSMLYHNII